MQTGDRLGYHPETARAELANFSRHYAEAVAVTEKMRLDGKPSIQGTNGARPTGSEAERTRDHQDRVSHALADLEDASK